MIRPLAVALVLYAGVAIAAEELQYAPMGTAVSDAFALDGKLIPLPEGRYVLAARTVSEPPMMMGDISKPRGKILNVFLAQTEPPRLRAGVWARVALEPPTYRFHWSAQPCRNEDVLYRADRGSGHSGESENCLLVEHRVGAFGSGSSRDVSREAAAWLAGEGVQLPVPLLIVANVTRIEQWKLVAAAYAFNPRMYGCDAPRSRSWAESPWHRKAVGDDPQRVRFVESVTAWGKLVQRHFDDLVAGRQSAIEKAPAIHSCAAAQAALP